MYTYVMLRGGAWYHFSCSGVLFPNSMDSRFAEQDTTSRLSVRI